MLKEEKEFLLMVGEGKRVQKSIIKRGGGCRRCSFQNN